MTDGALVNKDLLSGIKLHGSTYSYNIRKQHDLLFVETWFVADGLTLTMIIAYLFMDTRHLFMLLFAQIVYIYVLDKKYSNVLMGLKQRGHFRSVFMSKMMEVPYLSGYKTGFLSL